MRAAVKGSKRKLTATNLVVDWGGDGNLFFRMSKSRVKYALSNDIATMTEQLYGRPRTTTDFPVRRFRSGSIAIGCEHFNKAEVAELKKWSHRK